MAAFWLTREGNNIKLADAERHTRPAGDSELVDFDTLEMINAENFQYHSASPGTVALSIARKKGFMTKTHDEPMVTPFDWPVQDFCPYEDD